MRICNLVLAATLAAAATTACGDSKASAPTQPSPSPSATAPASSVTGASIGGTVVGVSGSAAAPFRTLGTGMTVTVTGSNLSSAVDDAGRFDLRGVPAGHVELHFSGRGADARLALDNVAEHEAIQMVVRVNGATAEIEDDNRQTPDNRVEIEGVVAAVNASAGTLRVADTLVMVPAGTTIRHGSTAFRLSDVRVGDRIHIHGTMNGTSIVATEVELQNEPADDDHGNPGPNPGPGTPAPSPAPTPNPAPTPGDDHGGNGDDHGEAEASGTVAGKGGTCPSIHFTVGSTTVQTSAGTEFKDVTCTALANGNQVEVKGTRPSTTSTTINATRVEKKK